MGDTNVGPGFRLPNGRTVLEVTDHDGGVSTVLAWSPTDVMRYVTWMMRTGEPDSTAIGSYHPDIASAVADYVDRGGVVA